MLPHIQTLISLIETLPLNTQKQVVEHLQEYIQQLTKNLDPQQKIILTDDCSSQLSPEELEILNNCTEILVWSPFDSIQ
ncbi:hypothetical protein [Dolichospermum sp. UHCC 0259]|uniref:hypothetical protein n=1 Tax=Dolichospermum sp. UHCC 0259 TaxID=2590010 RepID=UPI001447D1BF|nr:hypothetical protein [Dolichospermum sp. UHCC 0259]MTJ51069.1 hypothetical protein [Dolichospermum sp. UHCC 0259]